MYSNIEWTEWSRQLVGYHTGKCQWEFCKCDTRIEFIVYVHWWLPDNAICWINLWLILLCSHLVCSSWCSNTSLSYEIMLKTIPSTIQYNRENICALIYDSLIWDICGYLYELNNCSIYWHTLKVVISIECKIFSSNLLYIFFF